MFEQTFKNIDDVLWKEAGCTTELDYTEQTSWMLFLKYLDDLEQERAMEAELVGKRLAKHHPSVLLSSAYVRCIQTLSRRPRDHDPCLAAVAASVYKPPKKNLLVLKHL